MISTVIQKGSTVYVYNEKNSIIFTTNGTLLGYTGSTVTVERGSTAYVYNDKGSIISTHAH